jgi:PleD family two-component response regulator
MVALPPGDCPMIVQKSTILVADDSPTSCQILFNALNQTGYHVLVMASGEAVLEHVALQRPDLILLDVMMPGINGFETCRRLKAMTTTKDIPVIFMTALESTFDEVQGFQIGAVDYIIKPIQIDRVLIRVHTHLTLYRLQQELVEKNAQLADALARVRTLKGLLPICANCKKIRNDQGYWQQVEVYVRDHSDAQFSHGICPGCLPRLYPQYFDAKD